MKAEMTQVVMPSDANYMGTCFGGKIMSWIDLVAAIAAQKAVGSVVTASVDSIEFHKPISVGDVVVLKAAVNRIWNTSLEVGVKVYVHKPKKTKDDNSFIKEYFAFGEEISAVKAYVTFVAVYNSGEKRIIKNAQALCDMPIIGHLRRHEEAQKRKENRLTMKKV